jgi:hypothetical protein
VYVFQQTPGAYAVEYLGFGGVHSFTLACRQYDDIQIHGLWLMKGQLSKKNPVRNGTMPSAITGFL